MPKIGRNEFNCASFTIKYNLIFGPSFTGPFEFTKGFQLIIVSSWNLLVLGFMKGSSLFLELCFILTLNLTSRETMIPDPKS